MDHATDPITVPGARECEADIPQNIFGPSPSPSGSGSPMSSSQQWQRALIKFEDYLTLECQVTLLDMFLLTRETEHMYKVLISGAEAGRPYPRSGFKRVSGILAILLNGN